MDIEELGIYEYFFYLNQIVGEAEQAEAEEQKRKFASEIQEMKEKKKHGRRNTH